MKKDTSFFWLVIMPMTVITWGVLAFGATALPAEVPVTITAQEAAAVAWVLATPERPPAFDRVTNEARSFATASDVLRWLLDEPLAQLVARKQAEADAAEDPNRRTVYDRLKLLGPAQCLEVAKRLGVEVTVLPCGGYQ